MYPATAITSTDFNPVILPRHPIAAISSSTTSPTFQKNVCVKRVKSTLERPLKIVSIKNQLLGTINLPEFLSRLYFGLQEFPYPPKQMDITGGAVAYLIGPEKAKEYAEMEGIKNPDLSEFDRLKDLDIAFDMTGYPINSLYSMSYYVVRALQDSGIHKSNTELLESVFFRKKVIPDPKHALCILSVGDQSSFWVDFSFIARGRRHLFVRDNLKCDLKPFLVNKSYDLTWSTTAKNPMQPIRNRMEKKLDIDEVETINHLGFPLGLYYSAKGYQISDPDHLPSLAKKFMDFHSENLIHYAATFEAIRKNHIGDDLDLFEKMSVACFRVMLIWTPPELIKWVKDTQFERDNPQSRLFNFIKNGGMGKYRLNPSDILCLGDVMGVQPKLPIPDEIWMNFLNKKIPFDKQECLKLFSSSDSFPLHLARKIHQKALTVPAYSTQELFDLLETYDFNQDKNTFLAIQFDWECKHAPHKALETFKNHKNVLPLEKIKGLLKKIISLDCQDLQPYFPLIFSEPIDDILWLEKLLKENFAEEAIQLALIRNSKETYLFLLEKFFAMDQLQDLTDTLNQISHRNPGLHKELMQYTSWQDNFTRYLSNETDFKNKLKAFLKDGHYASLINLLKMNNGKFKVPAEDLQNLLKARAMLLFKENNFETLGFLIRLSITSKVNVELLLTLSENTLDMLLSSEKDPAKIEWAINFFSRPELSSGIARCPQKFIQLAASHLNKISSQNLEPILKIALGLIPSSNSPKTMKLIQHCMQKLEIHNRNRIAPLVNKLVSAIKHLIKSKDYYNLFTLLIEVRALRLKLPLPRDVFSAVLDLPASPDELYELSKVFDYICPLPDDVKRPLLEKHLLHIAIAKPKQAQAVFEHNLQLWSGSKESLKSLFDKLPPKAPVRYAIFLRMPEWSLEDWQMLHAIESLGENNLFKIFIDPRSRKFVDNAWILRLITFNVSIENAQKLLETLPTPPDASFLLVYLNKLKENDYPVEPCQQFIKFFLKLEADSFADPSVLAGCKEVLRSLHQNSPLSLIDTLHDLEPFIGKLSDKEKKDFTACYLDCLPKNFQDDLYSPEDRVVLNRLVDMFEIQSAFSVYLGLTETSLDKIERALKLMVEKNMYANDRHAIKKALACLSTVVSQHPQFWKPTGRPFVQNYLHGENVQLTSLDIVKALRDSDFIFLRYEYLNYAVTVDGLEEGKFILRHLETLLAPDRLSLVDDIIAKPGFQKYVQSGYLAGAFKKMVENFILEIVKPINNKYPDMWALKMAIQKIPLCSYKDHSFDKIWDQLATSISCAISIYCIGYVEDCYSIITEYSEMYSQYKSRDKTDALPAFLILDDLTTGFNPFKDANAQKGRMRLISDLLNYITPKVNAKTSQYYFSSVLGIFKIFHTRTEYQQDVEISMPLFKSLNEAIESKIFAGAYDKLLQTAIWFTGLTFDNDEVTNQWFKCLNNVFKCLFEEKAFSNIGKKVNASDYRQFVTNVLYTLPPTHPLFQELKIHALNMIKEIQLSIRSMPDASEVFSWNLYLNPGQSLPEFRFTTLMPYLTSSIREANKPKSFEWLIDSYYSTLISSNMNISKHTIGCLSTILGMLPMAKASHLHVIKITNFLNDFLPYCETHMTEPETNATLLTGTLLRWVLPNALDDFKELNILQSLDILKKLAASNLSKGSSIILFGTLKKLSDYVSSHYVKTTGDRSNVGKVLLGILSTTLSSPHIPDAASRLLWESTIFNICTSIITILGNPYSKQLKEILQGSQIRQLLPSKKIDELYETLLSIEAKAVATSE